MSRYPDYRAGTTRVRQRQFLFCSGAQDPRKVGEPIPVRTSRCLPRRAPRESYRQRPDRFQSEVFFVAESVWSLCVSSWPSSYLARIKNISGGDLFLFTIEHRVLRQCLTQHI